MKKAVPDLKTDKEAEHFVETIATSPDSEIERLRTDCSQFYQVIGHLACEAGLWDDPQVTKALDNAWAAASGEPRPHEDLTPFTAKAR